MADQSFAYLADLVERGHRVVLDTYVSMERDTIFVVSGAGVGAEGRTLGDALKFHKSGRERWVERMG